jgi:hypothetical protein
MSVPSHLFQLAHFGSFPVQQLFPSFGVPDFRGRFGVINSVFRALHRKYIYSSYKNFQWATIHLNQDRMQNLQPREVDVLTYQNGLT